MRDISIVGRLVYAILAIAFTAACAGTLGDLVFDSKNSAALALKKGGISYGKWNRQLFKSSGQRHKEKKQTGKGK